MKEALGAWGTGGKEANLTLEILVIHFPSFLESLIFQVLKNKVFCNDMKQKSEFVFEMTLQLQLHL